MISLLLCLVFGLHHFLSQTMAHLICQVYCHILYWHHDAFAQLEALPHLNTCFKWFIPSLPSLVLPVILFVHHLRFILFCKQFRLLDETDLVPIQDLVSRIYEVDLMQSSSGGAPGGPQGGDSGSTYQDDIQKRISTASSSMFSDDVSKLTLPTIDYQGDRLLSEHSIDLSAYR